MKGVDSGTVVVEEKWPQGAFDWIQQVVFLGVAIAIFLRLWFLTLPAPDQWQREALLVGGLGFVVVLDLAVWNKISCQRVEIDSTGVTFHHPFRVERVAWQELSPGPFRPALGGWVLAWSRTDKHGRSRTSAISVSVAQGRAIVSHPARPRWTIPPLVARGLGVSSEV